MSFLVDTSVISELRKRDRADAGVLHWFNATNDDELFLSVLVVGELRRGVEGVRRRDPRGAAALDAWVAAVASGYADHILPITPQIADTWGRLNVPDPLPVIDSLLAATALVHGLTVVSRNAADFARTGVPTLNPFTAGPKRKVGRSATRKG